MARKKRRSSKFRDSSTVIDIEQARQARQARQEERQEKIRKMEAKNKKPRSEADPRSSRRRALAQTQEMDFIEDLYPEEFFAEEEALQTDTEMVKKASKRPKARTRSGQAKSEEPVSGEMNMRQDRRKMALRRRKRNRNLIIAGVLAALLVIVGISAGQIFVLQHDLHTAKKQQEAYKEEKAQLEKDLKQIDDLQNLEEQARDQMRLIRPGETLYIFPENMTVPVTIEESDQTGDNDKSEDAEKDE